MENSVQAFQMLVQCLGVLMKRCSLIIRWKLYGTADSNENTVQQCCFAHFVPPSLPLPPTPTHTHSLSYVYNGTNHSLRALHTCYTRRKRSEQTENWNRYRSLETTFILFIYTNWIILVPFKYLTISKAGESAATVMPIRYGLLQL